ncbi:MAG: sigma-70 family RNA polymerase sigma factor [Planctomycetes bacterium]|nr:sigma-70 family RNA polymerase sigma factor [Planctomycetota bacterium]
MANSSWKDKLLIRRFNQGHLEALRKMYARYRVDLVTLATGLLFDKDLAEDVVHEVFARLAENHARISIVSSLRGYLLRAVANTARNANRARRGLNQARAHPEAVDLRVVPAPELQAIQAEQSERLPGALQELPYEQREVILLRHYVGLRFKGIAQCQGVPVSTVQGRYRYGLDKLRSLLGGGP